MTQSDAFGALDEHRKQLKEHIRRLHTTHTHARRAYTRNTQYFTVIILSGALILLIASALFFDYMIALNVTLARATLWTTLATVFVSVVRIMHILVLTPPSTARTARALERRMRRRIDAMERYTRGEIDADGIRLLYTQDAVTPPQYIWAQHIADYILGTLLLLSIALFALTFAP